MKLKYLLLVFCIIVISGCSNTNIEEDEKNEYIAMKSNLLKSNKFSEDKEELPCNITVSVDRINDEEVSYRVILDKPKEDMNNVKALVVHNYYTEDIFPSIGLFDDSESLIVGNKDVKGIELVGYINTSKDIEKLKLELKLWIQYNDNNGEKKEIYYKTT